MFAEKGQGQEYMVRSHTHKLLWCKNPDQSQFFDLQEDPFELDNRIHDPTTKAQITEMKNALVQWMLFDAPSCVHLDENAPTINQPNVPSKGDEHRETLYTYFQERMNEK
jgi:hypothetical protein